MEYEVEGSRPRGRPNRTWKEIVQKDCQARNSNKEDAMGDHKQQYLPHTSLEYGELRPTND